MSAKVLHGNCRELMAAMPDNSVDALVTDPPYGLGRTPPIVEILTRWLAGEDVEASGGGFMGRSWDSFVPGPATWREALRVLKPGAHGVVFAGDRTVDLMAIALRLAGFEVRHVGAWVSAQVFPKSLDVSKAIDALAGAEREVVGSAHRKATGRMSQGDGGYAFGEDFNLTRPATPEAAQWTGYGTAIKTIEPWVLVRKPLSESSIARNVLRWGTGALNIDGCRLPWASEREIEDAERGAVTWGVYCPDGSGTRSGYSAEIYGHKKAPQPKADGSLVNRAGRWPSALIASDLDAEGPVEGVRVIGEVDGDGHIADLDGILGPYTRHFRIPGTDGEHDEAIPPEVETLIICPKASKADREEGLDGFDAGWVNTSRRNVHPTVKPIALMRHLVRLVTPPSGTVLDPFTGSGSTGVAAVWEGRSFVGCEMTDSEREPFVRIARARVAYAERTPAPELRTRQPKAEVDERQMDMFAEVGT